MATSSLRSAFTRTPFVARETELAELRRLLDEAAAGQGALVLIGGEPGIGKSRLTEELGDAARGARFRVLAGHCYEGNATAPYLPLVEAVRDPEKREEAERLVSQLLSAGVDATERDLAPEHERHFLFNSVRDFFAELSSEQPVLLVLEDLHWAAAPAVLLLRHLAGSLETQRILVIGTFRPAEPGAELAIPLSGLLEDVRRLKRGFSMELGPLPESGVSEMVATLAGSEPPNRLVRAIFEQTEGNPFFVEEIVKQLAEEGRLVDARGRWADYTTSDDLDVPESVRTVIERRLRYISEECRRTLTSAAVVGRAFDFDLLAAVTEKDPDGVLDSLDEAVRARLIASAGPAYDPKLSFSHELIRQTLLAQISAPRRQRLHLRVLQAIEERYGSDAEDRIAQLAHHSLRAGGAADNETTIRYATRAADRAMAATAYEEAARLYRYVLRLTPFGDGERRCETMLRLGVAERRVTDSEEARELFIEAATLARQLGDAERLARAALGFARSWPTVGVVDGQAVELLREAEATLAPEPTALRAQVVSRLAVQLLYGGDLDEVAAMSREAVLTARKSGDLASLARVLQSHHVTIWQPQYIEERLAVATEMMQISRQLGIEEIALWSHRPHIADLTAMGEIEAAENELAVYVELADAYRQPIYIWQAAVRRCMLATFRGRLQEAERLATEAFAIGQRAGGQNLTAAFGEQMLIVRWLQGRLKEIEPLAAASHRGQPSMAIWRAVLAFIYIETGREAEARRELDWISADGFTRLAHDDTRLIAAVLLSIVAAKLGDAEAADELYEELVPYEGRNMTLSEGVTCVGASEEYLGVLAATCRRWEMAERHFRAALEFNERTGGRPWLALTQTDYGLMLMSRRGPGDRKRAGELFQAALTTAGELGMAALRERLERLLASHKGLVTKLPDGLTRREAEVLRLVATGMSNKEVSEELVLSLRTTARHVTNIYAKIGARNRADATSYAIRNRLIDG